MPAGQRTAESASRPVWRETFHAERKDARRGAGSGARLDCEQRRAFALYVDEFQNISTESFEAVLTEARKFGLCLPMAHQSLKQLDDRLVSLILGNAQTQIYLRVSRQDAERLSKEIGKHRLAAVRARRPSDPGAGVQIHAERAVGSGFSQYGKGETTITYSIKGAADAPELPRGHYFVGRP